MKRNTLLTLTALLLAPLAAADEPRRPGGCLADSGGAVFPAGTRGPQFRFGDAASIFANGGDLSDLTFDVSNLRVLGNLGRPTQGRDHLPRLVPPLRQSTGL